MAGQEGAQGRGPDREEPGHHRREVPPLFLATWESAVSDPDPLVALGATRALMGHLSAWEAKLAAEAVAQGATWERIGSSVGVSRQAAWERFHRDVAEFRRQVRQEARALKERHRDEMHKWREEVKQRALEHWLG
jgi:hypothetical protein